jgi:hypothetical protein
LCLTSRSLCEKLGVFFVLADGLSYLLLIGEQQSAIDITRLRLISDSLVTHY